MSIRWTGIAFAVILVAVCVPASARSASTEAPAAGMKMPMAMPAEPSGLAPTRQAYTTNRRFLVKLLSMPTPIPFEKYFSLRFAVYDGNNPSQAIPDVHLTVLAGMRHGKTHGFAHGMQSSPKVEAENGVYTVAGMFFTMMGPWTLETRVEKGSSKGTAYFQLPCCGP